ncbi:hypothetical protein [Pedobacter aquatilis]|uniref:hypothetical protein n=1 Tax=Pedobacter aquatilis TaxID=351343 RepID=UPI00292F014E|nr:hypothetical protein [Pedobacter aquatilis]
MKKVLLSLLMVAGLGFAASAQTEGAVQKLSVGAEFGLPTEKGAKDFLYLGGSLQYEHPVAKDLNLTGSAGYLSLTYTGQGSFPSIGLIPVKAGAKYYFGGNFYGAAELGAVFGTETGSTTLFTVAPTLGASFSVSEKSNLDFGLRYENLSGNGGSTGFVGLRAAWAFGL